MTDTAGLYRKFDVKRVDPKAQERHPDCAYFVLDVEHDPAALPALIAYAKHVEVTHPVLASDLRNLVHNVAMKRLAGGGRR